MILSLRFQSGLFGKKGRVSKNKTAIKVTENFNQFLKSKFFKANKIKIGKMATAWGLIKKLRPKKRPDRKYFWDFKNKTDSTNGKVKKLSACPQMLLLKIIPGL